MIPANSNPWYCLLTLHGEPEDEFDFTTRDENRKSWNRLLARELDEEDRCYLRDKNFPSEELAPLDEDEFNAFRLQFARRFGKDEFPGIACADFSFTKFDKPISFSGYLFEEVNCESSQFFQGANFEHAICFSSATFKNAHFVLEANFREAVFKSTVEFLNVNFATIANFVSVHFEKIVVFSGATFREYADFSNSTFFHIGSFATVHFYSLAHFSNVRFVSTLIFNGTIFSDVYFRGVKVEERSDFRNSRHEGLTEFTGSAFYIFVPDFRDASFKEATDWHDVGWPQPPKTRLSDFDRQKREAREQVSCYQRLKQEMEKLKKHEDELIFFRKELRAKRGTFRVLSPNWCLNALYQVSSNYGQSLALPIFWLGVLFFLETLLFAKIAVVEGEALPINDAVSLSFANIFSFLSLKRDFFDAKMLAQFSRPALYISAVESVVSVILLFLFGLALRNRFRIK